MVIDRIVVFLDLLSLAFVSLCLSLSSPSLSYCRHGCYGRHGRHGRNLSLARSLKVTLLMQIYGNFRPCSIQRTFTFVYKHFVNSDAEIDELMQSLARRIF